MANIILSNIISVASAAHPLITSTANPLNLGNRKNSFERCKYCEIMSLSCDASNGGPGFVYCLSNEAYHTKEGIPLYKIGLTIDEKRRKSQLFSGQTGVPSPFVLAFAKRVPCMWAFENMLHKNFDKDRWNKSREFFTTPLDEIRRAFVIWLPGPLLTKPEDFIKTAIDVVPSDVVASNDASSDDSSSDDSSSDDSTNDASTVA
jgi:hypothetical protein